MTDWMEIEDFKDKPEDILANRREGMVFVANFVNSEGRYISTVINSKDPVDAIIKISPRIELRFTYIFSEKDVRGLQITKLNGDKTIGVINMSAIDWQNLLKLLHIFRNIDFDSIAKGSLILDASIIGDKEKLEKLLSTIAADPEGAKKFEEVARNFGLLKSGEVEKLAKRTKAFKLMDNLLNNPDFFARFKEANKFGKNEEVWQKFFQVNDWMLGSDVIQILDDRVVDEDSIVDLPIESLDGFLDVIELKLPNAPIWTKEGDPASELAKATLQCMRYLGEYERRANDYKKIKSLGVEIIKPRITLVYGRSKDWDEEGHKRLRLLNSSYHNITILTYDHIYQRAKKTLEITR